MSPLPCTAAQSKISTIVGQLIDCTYTIVGRLIDCTYTGIYVLKFNTLSFNMRIEAGQTVRKGHGAGDQVAGAQWSQAVEGPGLQALGDEY